MRTNTLGPEILFLPNHSTSQWNELRFSKNVSFVNPSSTSMEKGRVLLLSEPRKT